MSPARTRHLSASELDRLLAGEPLDDPSALDHFEGCETCRRERDALAALVSLAHRSPVALSDDYGERVWQRLRPELERRSSRTSWIPLRLAAAAGLVIAVLATVAVRTPWRSRPSEVEGPDAGAARDALFVEAVDTHLERSRRLFIELSNLSPGDDGAVAAAALEARARRLLEENRRYLRMAAGRGSDLRNTLGSLEAVLAEAADDPAQRPIEEDRLRDLLFETRLAQVQLARAPVESSPRSPS